MPIILVLEDGGTWTMGFVYTVEISDAEYEALQAGQEPKDFPSWEKRQQLDPEILHSRDHLNDVNEDLVAQYEEASGNTVEEGGAVIDDNGKYVNQYSDDMARLYLGLEEDDDHA